MVTKEQIEELLDSFVETEHVYYGMAIDCIMAGKTERLANELFELVSNSNGVANNQFDLTTAKDCPRMIERCCYRIGTKCTQEKLCVPLQVN